MPPLVKSAASWLTEATQALRGSGVGATLLRASSGTLLVTGLSAGVAIPIQIGLSRLLGVEEFGRYAYALNWVNLLSLLCVLGLDTTSLKLVARYRVTGEWAALRGFLQRSLAMAMALAVVAGACVAIAGRASHFNGQGLSAVMVWAGALLPVIVFLRMLSSYLQGFRRVIVGPAVQGVVRPALVGGTLLGLWHAEVGLRADGAMLLNLASTVLCVILVAMFCYATIPVKALQQPAEYHTRQWLTTAGPLLLITASQALLASTDTLMLGMMRGPEQAGLYSVAAQLVTVITLGISAANGIVAPMIAELDAAGDRAGIRRLLAISARGVMAYAIPVILFLLLLGRPLLGLYGKEFEASWVPMMVLALGQFGIVAFGSVGFLLTMSGHERAASVTIAASAVLNIVLNFLLIPRWGVLGAAMATSVATISRSLILTLWAWRKLGMTATAFGS